jgi:hypothetical protein
MPVKCWTRAKSSVSRALVRAEKAASGEGCELPLNEVVWQAVSNKLIAEAAKRWIELMAIKIKRYGIKEVKILPGKV